MSLKSFFGAPKDNPLDLALTKHEVYELLKGALQ
jgi:hypothetical protein